MGQGVMDTTADSGVRPKKVIRAYSLGEEIANSIIHGVGVLLSIAALTLLIVFGVMSGSGVKLAAGIVYGLSLVLEYTASTLYHSLTSERGKYVFKILDHCGIYLLIAGSYTPFLLVTLAGQTGWIMFAAIWGIAIAGIVAEAFWVYRPRWVSALTYLGMGWLVVLAIEPLVDALAPGGLWLLVAGGLAYTLGTIFYVLKKVPYMHAIWHLFVLAGSICHFLAVVLFVMPPY
jgi:hemolysin III